MSSTERRLQAGIEAVRKGGAHALGLFNRRDELVIEKKGRQDLVSRADRETETIIRDVISAQFPEDGFLGEEYGSTGGTDRLWIIDPIDGTSNYLQGIPYWGILLAYVENGRPLLSFTYDACRDELWTAEAGKGAKRNEKPIHCAGTDKADEAIMALSFNFKTDPEVYTTMLAAAIRKGIDHRRIGSTALKLAYVADGRFDASVSMLTNAWDVVPGLLLVKEAGGCITDFTAGGHPLTKPAPAAACAPGIRGVIEEITGLTLDG
ncbi:MAG TPA: inositol monophosphatase [Geminicoccus sp.]|jgi:myo-inositol-1(or 4)-monophosphatase|uniref:inositol monophosphatase family protein n=1 Tax=Geminicoccus sp. TaxID=2024832 RepID=UPI002E37ADCB|nr:inositol monophosphatase [Geminicoccus sp.]HEX2527296.1 inositol monophosphatase [Geminicoccus sp.]